MILPMCFQNWNLMKKETLWNNSILFIVGGTPALSVVLDPRLELCRTRTIMEGHGVCDFRYRLKG